MIWYNMALLCRLCPGHEINRKWPYKWGTLDDDINDPSERTMKRAAKGYAPKAQILLESSHKIKPEQGSQLNID
ncbi:hypothetical protein VM1G_12083 [Cytospora mali]|uniref:Uncharacterized protein n=1 Tax=Cytospora mali TaxID=578113 RepID=A0A194VKA9_CYTMA|nr:hypothetical protein VM1G_12083 [Valsa mali]